MAPQWNTNFSLSSPALHNNRKRGNRWSLYKNLHDTRTIIHPSPPRQRSARLIEETQGKMVSESSSNKQPPVLISNAQVLWLSQHSTFAHLPCKHANGRCQSHCASAPNVVANLPKANTRPIDFFVALLSVDGPGLERPPSLKHRCERLTTGSRGDT